MEKFDVSVMDYAELSGLREAIDARVAELREVEGPALRQRFAEQAAVELGLSLEALVRGPNAKGPGRPRNKAATEASAEAE